MKNYNYPDSEEWYLAKDIGDFPGIPIEEIEYKLHNLKRLLKTKQLDKKQYNRIKLR